MKHAYVLLDSRAGVTLADEIDYKGSMVVLAGTAKECCDAANRKDYGDGCVVATPKGIIMWEWYSTGKWVPK